MKPTEIIRILKEAANFTPKYDQEKGLWSGYGSIINCPECKNMTTSEYCSYHYPAKKALLESLPWSKTVEHPRCPQPDEYPSEDGEYIVMLDCDEHAVLTNSFKNGHWCVYDQTHVKWWMPIWMLLDINEVEGAKYMKQLEVVAIARFCPKPH